MENQLPVFQANGIHPDLHGAEHANTLLTGKAQTSILRKVYRARGISLWNGIQPGKRLPFEHRLHICLLCAPEAILINQPDKFQLLEQPVQLRLVIGADDGILRRKINGRLRADGGKVIGQIGILPVVFQLLPELGTDGRILQILIHPVQTAELRQQLLRRLGADPGDTGNVVRGIAHKSLEINQLFRLKPVLLPEFLLGIEGSRGLPGLGNHQLHPDILIDQLQRIPVTGDNDTLPAVV